VRHNVRFNGAENHVQYRLAEEYGDDAQHGRKRKAGIEKLLCRKTRAFVVAAPDILGRNDRAARCQRRKQRDEQKVDGVHKGDAGNRRFAAGGDHYGIRHTDGYGQKLLNNKGYDELPQIFV